MVGLVRGGWEMGAGGGSATNLATSSCLSSIACSDDSELLVQLETRKEKKQL